MSRDPYRSSGGDLPYGGRGGGGGQRWDSDRFAAERDRARFGSGDRERFEERDSSFLRAGPAGRARERSVDEIYDRRGPRGFEEDRIERRTYDYEEPRYAPERAYGRDRGQSIHIEKEREREVIDREPPRRGSRPAFLRRQSSLDTFDRKPLVRYSEREEYGPPCEI